MVSQPGFFKRLQGLKWPRAATSSSSAEQVLPAAAQRPWALSNSSRPLTLRRRTLIPTALVHPLVHLTHDFGSCISSTLIDELQKHNFCPQEVLPRFMTSTKTIQNLHPIVTLLSSSICFHLLSTLYLNLRSRKKFRLASGALPATPATADRSAALRRSWPRTSTSYVAG